MLKPKRSCNPRHVILLISIGTIEVTNGAFFTGHVLKTVLIWWLSSWKIQTFWYGCWAHFKTPFIFACDNNALESVLILLCDARVDINCSNNGGNTGLMWAAHQGYSGVIEYILASMRHIQSTDITNAIEKRKSKNKNDTVSLLEAYQANHFETTKNLRSKLIIFFHFLFLFKHFNLTFWIEYGPVNVFVHVILLSDEYYTLISNNENEKQDKARQFFRLMLKLPMDLQMVVCNRMFDLPKDSIKSQLIDQALKFMVADGNLNWSNYIW